MINSPFLKFFIYHQPFEGNVIVIQIGISRIVLMQIVSMPIVSIITVPLVRKIIIYSVLQNPFRSIVTYDFRD